jgi:predicted nucleic acid-binding protein
MRGSPFFDTNILVYAFVKNDPRTAVSLGLLATPCILSVQVLNEFSAVALRKLRMSWSELAEALDTIRIFCPDPLPVTVETHKRALEIMRRYRYNIFDALLIAAALNASCTSFYSEDMHHGQVIDGLTIRDPFRKDVM